MSYIESKYENARSIIKAFIRHGVLTGHSSEERYCTIWDAALEAQGVIANDGWISVDDRLPEMTRDCDHFLVVSYGEVDYAKWEAFSSCGGECGESHDGNVFVRTNSDSDYGGLFVDEGITYWMELPKPPAK